MWRSVCETGVAPSKPFKTWVSEKTGGACCQAIFLPVPRDAGDALTLHYWNSEKLPKLLWSVHSLSDEQQRCLAALSLAGISESLCDHWLCDEQQLPTLTFTSQDQWKCPAPAEAWGCIDTSDSVQRWALVPVMEHLSVGATLHYLENPWKFFLTGILTSGIL